MSAAQAAYEAMTSRLPASWNVFLPGWDRESQKCRDDWEFAVAAACAVKDAEIARLKEEIVDLRQQLDLAPWQG